MKRIWCALIAIVFLLTACSQQAAPIWQEQYDLGVRYLAEGNYEEAIIAFTAAIEIDPKQAPAYVGRGDTYVQYTAKEDHVMLAVEDYGKAIALDDQFVEVYEKLANVYLHEGNIDAAISILQQGLDLTDSASLQALMGEIRLNESAHIDELPRFYATVSNIELQSPLIGHNEGSVGQLAFNFSWDTSQIPDELDEIIYTALIATWSPDGFTTTEIRDYASKYETIWGEESSLWKDYPHSGNAFPVWEDDLGTTQQVLLYALDGTGTVLGYLILSVPVPKQ